MHDDQIEQLIRQQKELMSAINHLGQDMSQSNEDIALIRKEFAEMTGSLAVLVYGQAQGKKKLTVSSITLERSWKRVLSYLSPEMRNLLKTLPTSNNG